MVSSTNQTLQKELKSDPGRLRLHNLRLFLSLLTYMCCAVDWLPKLLSAFRVTNCSTKPISKTSKMTTKRAPFHNTKHTFDALRLWVRNQFHVQVNETTLWHFNTGVDHAHWGLNSRESFRSCYEVTQRGRRCTCSVLGLNFSGRFVLLGEFRWSERTHSWSRCVWWTIVILFLNIC